MNNSHVSTAIGLLFIGCAMIGIFKTLVQVFRSAPLEIVFRFLSRKTESKSMKIKQELIRLKQAQERRLAEQERVRNHYKYKNEIKLNIVLKDRHFLFGAEHDQGWDYDQQKYGFIPNAQGIRNLCFLMFAEMAGRRVWILKNNRLFWTQEKESYWQKICPKKVMKMIPNTNDFFRSQMEKQAMADFDSDFIDQRKVC